MTETPTVLKIENVWKTFRIGFFRKRVAAVKGVGFEVARGEIFGLLGPNGAGKTTTLKMVMDLIRPDAGKITLLGTDSSCAAARQRVGYLPENPYFHEYLRPDELLRFYGRLYGMTKEAQKKRSAALLETVGLSDARRKPLKKFSKGMLQRIGLAQAMLNDPDVLVLDEPMSGLDPLGRKFVADMILELNREGKTIVFSSHILSDVERLCQRVVILRHGEKVAEGKMTDLLKTNEAQSETLEALFVRLAQGGETRRDGEASQ